MKKQRTFHELVMIDVLRLLVDEFKSKGYQLFHKNSKGVLIDVTETLFSGGLVPVLVYQMNRRLFQFREGREMTAILDQFTHNLNISIYNSPRSLCNAEIGEVRADMLPVSKEEFIFLLRDAIYSLYYELPLVSDCFGGQGTEKQRYVTPMIEMFTQWLAINHQLLVCSTTAPESLENLGFDPNVMLNAISKTLEFLNNKQPHPYFDKGYISKPFTELLQQQENSNAINTNLI